MLLTSFTFHQYKSAFIFMKNTLLMDLPPSSSWFPIPTLNFIMFFWLELFERPLKTNIQLIKLDMVPRGFTHMLLTFRVILIYRYCQQKRKLINIQLYRLINVQVRRILIFFKSFRSYLNWLYLFFLQCILILKNHKNRGTEIIQKNSNWPQEHE